MSGIPAFQFYAGDWLRDPALRACSLAARGLWIDLMAYMHQAEPYGHLCVNGQPVTPAIAARLVGESERKVTALLAELDAAGVFSRREDGAIYSRRMVRDEAVRRKRAAGGKLGGNPNLRGTAKDGNKVNLPANLAPTPSSSVFSLQSSEPSHTSPRPETEVAPPVVAILGNGYARTDPPQSSDRAARLNGQINAVGDLLAWFNGKTGKNYQARSPGGHVTEIAATIGDRLGEGYTPQQLRTAAARKIREWSGTDMARNLTPTVLWGAKFPAYLGECVDDPEAASG